MTRTSKPVPITVVDTAGKPVVGFEVYGADPNWGWQKKSKADFNVSDLKAVLDTGHNRLTWQRSRKLWLASTK